MLRYKLPEPPLLTSADKKTGREELLEQIRLVLEQASGDPEKT
jgi:hypothetical protein